MRRPRGEPGHRAPRPTLGAICAGPGESCRGRASAERAAGGRRELVLATVTTVSRRPRAGWAWGALTSPTPRCHFPPAPSASTGALRGGRCVLVSQARRLRQRDEATGPRSRSWVSITQLHASSPALCPGLCCAAVWPAAVPTCAALLSGAQQVGGPASRRSPPCSSCAGAAAASGAGEEPWGAAALAGPEPYQGFPSDGPLVCALQRERRLRLPPKPPPPLQPVLRGGQRLEAALSCPHFLRHPQQRLIRSLAEARPEELTPHVMVLLAQHLARHRLREARLLEAIAHFLVVQEGQLNSKAVQKLVLPFGRLNYFPLEQQFMPCLERILAREAGVAPLATVNILMSLCQLQCLPFRALHFVFSPGFISHISGTPHALIVRRYLSLLDAAVELELPGYRGPRLPQRLQVPIFPQPLITDRARCKYSHKDIVAEGLRQLLGEERYRQDLTVPPGYCTDFLLCVSSSGAVLPVRTQDPFLPYPPRSCPQGQAASQPTTRDAAQRVVLMLRERWHFCRDSRVLLGSRALRERHLGLLGYQLLPLPFEELESQRGLPQLKSYLKQKLQALGLRWGPEGG
ncbi:fas-activated serine/threonine kinase isoform X1 [Phyllostomus hastatus]|uniref:fas-activated serine/threonine kinase isoform X1 n=1 Tax=Phyllostomus hastatus TaxID=9423 RepID=UPI001E6819E9|nr:fas-activated serine/threonine kinase isoform X1 [Phyllostomus hastatus]